MIRKLLAICLAIVAVASPCYSIAQFNNQQNRQAYQAAAARAAQQARASQARAQQAQARARAQSQQQKQFRAQQARQQQIRQQQQRQQQLRQNQIRTQRARQEQQARQRNIRQQQMRQRQASQQQLRQQQIKQQQARQQQVRQREDRQRQLQVQQKKYVEQSRQTAQRVQREQVARLMQASQRQAKMQAMDAVARRQMKLKESRVQVLSAQKAKQQSSRLVSIFKQSKPLVNQLKTASGTRLAAQSQAIRSQARTQVVSSKSKSRASRRSFHQATGSRLSSSARPSSAVKVMQSKLSFGATQPPRNWPHSKLALATNSQLQKKYKHAADFGVKGNSNKENLKKFRQAINSHLNNPVVREIVGTYRGKNATISVNPGTRLAVIREPDGKFISGWKLSKQQLNHVLTSGKLGGG